jgi:hypothetical protein
LRLGQLIPLVMPCKGEPEKVLSADGLAVNDLAQGLALSKANVDNVFSNEQINFSFENTLFYDALAGYLGDGSLDRSATYGADSNSLDRSSHPADFNIFRRSIQASRLV